MSLSRLRALLVVAVLTIFAIVTVVWTITRDSQHQTPSHQTDCAAALSQKIPTPNQVKVKVLNATDRSGLATSVKQQLEERGFIVVGVDNSDISVSGTAVVRYGPSGVPAAHLIRAEVPNAEVMPESMKGDVVELILGPEYDGLTPTDQVERALKKLGKPVVPSVLCEEDITSSSNLEAAFKHS